MSPVQQRPIAGRTSSTPAKPAEWVRIYKQQIVPTPEKHNGKKVYLVHNNGVGSKNDEATGAFIYYETHQNELAEEAVPLKPKEVTKKLIKYAQSERHCAKYNSDIDSARIKQGILRNRYDYTVATNRVRELKRKLSRLNIVISELKKKGVFEKITLKSKESEKTEIISKLNSEIRREEHYIRALRKAEQQGQRKSKRRNSM